MANLQVKKLAKTTRSSYWGRFKVDTTWDATNVSDLIQRVVAATMGTSLAQFLVAMANPYMTDEIVQRFAYEGDSKSGNWAPLSDTTQRIREAMGFSPDGPINERDGELLDFMINSRDYIAGDDWAMMQLPGDPPSFALEQKLLHAQQGAHDNGLFPGAQTPPRPVLATGPDDMMTLLKLLQVHVMAQIAMGI